MFSFLKKKEARPTLLADRIWAEKSTRYQGIFLTAQELMQRKQIVVLISFFPETQRELEFVLQNAELPLHTATALSKASLNPSQVVSIAASEIVQDPQLEKLPNASYHFMVAEHYPTPTPEQHLLEALRRIPAASMWLTYFESLDSLLFQRFTSERFHTLLKTMGFKEEEELSHKFITQAIRNAQKKVKSETPFEKQTDSAEDWFRENLPR